MDNSETLKPQNISNKKPRLGRGLGSLFGDISSRDASGEVDVALAEQASPAIERQPSIDEKKYRESRIWKIDIEKIGANQQQPRNHFEKEKLQELAESIKVHGILNPIVARKLDAGGFEIIAGERRWRAAQLAGLKQVPVILREVPNQDSLELALIENIQRQDLNAVDEARAYKRLIEEYGLTQEETALRVGKERSTVANSIRLLVLPPEVLQMIVEGKLTVGHAKVLLGIADAKKQIELAKRVSDEKLSVRGIEKLLTEFLSIKGEKQGSDSAVVGVLVRQLKEELQKSLGTKVDIAYNKGRGRLSLSFYTDEQLNQIVDRLKN